MVQRLGQKVYSSRACLDAVAAMGGDEKMKRSDFEVALERAVETMLDGGSPAVDDVKLIDKAVGHADLLLMDKGEMEMYLFGVESGYRVALGETWASRFWEDEE